MTEDLFVHVGNRIKSYRKANNLSIENLAELIHKSKASVSKYENAKINIDIGTLVDISNALAIELNQLIDIKSKISNDSLNFNKNPFKSSDKIYLYFYDGRFNKIKVSVIEIFVNNSANTIDATFFLNIHSYKRYIDCEYLYHGSVKFFDTITSFKFQNQNNPIENIVIYSVNPLRDFICNSALLSGISSKPLQPVSLKAIISKKILPETEFLKNSLIITKDEIKNMKKLNMFTIEDISIDFETELKLKNQ